MYMQIRLPLACLLIMLYCCWYYIRRRRLATRASRAFKVMVVIAIVNLVAATVTEYTVNNRAIVPEAFNYVWHVVFITSLTAFCGILLVYVLLLVERDGGGNHRKAKVFVSALCCGVFIAQLFLPIEYIDTPDGSYSYGWKAYALYVVVAYVLVMLVYLALRYRKNLGGSTSGVLLASTAIFVAASLVQIAFPHILITSLAITLIMLGLMMNTEDSHLYVSTTTGMYNKLACRKLIQERLASEGHVEMGFYMFFGDEPWIHKAMHSVEEQVVSESRNLMCGMFANDVLLVLPMIKMGKYEALPDPLPVPEVNREKVHYRIQTLSFDNVEDYDYLQKTLRDMRGQYGAEDQQLDELTQLVRRNAFMSQVNGMIERGEAFAFLMLDLDDLKTINDSLGHAAGDDVLKAVADALRRSIRTTDIACRLGGDEFAIMLRGTPFTTNVRMVVQRIMDRLSDPKQLPHDLQKISVSVGVREYNPAETQTAFLDLYEQADTALYEVKRSGKGSVAFYSACPDGENKVHMNTDEEAVDPRQYSLF